MNAPSPNMQMAPPNGGGYPAGSDVVAQRQGADGMVDNPVIAGLRSIMMLVKTLVDRGDPRGAQAAQHVAGLLQTLQGAPMESPIPSQQQPVMPEDPPAGENIVGGGPAPEMPAPPTAPAPAPVPTQGPAPDGEMAFNPFKPPESEPQSPQKKPPVPQNRGAGNAIAMNQAPGKRPVVLT